MPELYNITHDVGNQSIVWVNGSGFTKSNFALKGYCYVDANDNPSSTTRAPHTVVRDFIRNGLTYELNPASGTSLQNTTTVLSDSTAYMLNAHYATTTNDIYCLYPFNTPEGTGNALWVNRPVIYSVEKTQIKKNRAYKIWGRSLYNQSLYNWSPLSATISDPIAGNFTDTYKPLVYLCSQSDPSGNNLYLCSNIGPDGVTQEAHEEDWYAYTNFIVPTGVPDGTYNLYYYNRLNKAGITTFSGINVYKNVPEPSAIIFNTSSYFTPSTSVSRSLQLQNLIYIAGSSVLANSNSKAYIVFENSTYYFENTFNIISGVNLIGNGAQLNFSPDIDYNILYSVNIPSYYNGTQFLFINTCMAMNENTSIDNFHLNFGDDRMCVPYGIYLKKRHTSQKQWGGNISITNCLLHCNFKSQQSLIYTDIGFWENIEISDNEFYGYHHVDGYKDTTRASSLRRNWSVQRNTFTGNASRVGGTCFAGLGSNSVLAANVFQNSLRGFVHSETNGPCGQNLICNNLFQNGGEYFNSSEYMLFENSNSSRYLGPVIEITPSSLRIPPTDWYATGGNSGVNDLLNCCIIVKDGKGKGQIRRILSSTVTGTLQYNPFDVPFDSGSIIDIGTGSYQNNICNNKFTDALGGLEFYGRNTHHYVSSNSFIRSERGIHLYADSDGSDSLGLVYKNRGICSYNTFTKNQFNNSQIIIDTPIVQGWARTKTVPSVSGYEIFAYNNFHNAVFTDSMVSYNCRVYSGSTDLHDSPYASSLIPVFSNNSFARVLFDTVNWRANSYKVMNYTPFSVSPVGFSGLITTSYFNATKINVISSCGFELPLNSGLKYLKGSTQNGVRKWAWA